MSSRFRNARFHQPMYRCLVLAAITLLACGEVTEPSAPPPAPPLGPPVSLSIAPSSLVLFAGGQRQLVARAIDSMGRNTNASVEWSSADLAIATVGSADGRVTAISAGSTTINARAGTLSATALVVVIHLEGTIAFTRLGFPTGHEVTFDVLAFSAPDGALQSIHLPAQFPLINAPAWSPDGTLLAVEVVDPGSVRIIDDELIYESDIYVVRAAAPADSPWRALTTRGHGRSPSWSPDGAHIAYLAPSSLPEAYDIYVIDAGGGTPLALTHGDGSYGKPSWSPDGTRLAFSAALAGNQNDIFTLNADGSALTNVTRSAGYEADPSWSPDGSRLAFVSDTPVFANTGVSVIDTDGRNRRTVIGPTGRWSSGPVWSPDGGQIVFALAATTPTETGIYVMDANGSWLFQLTAPPSYTWDVAPSWRR